GAGSVWLARPRAATERPGEAHLPAARPTRRSAAPLPTAGRGLVAVPPREQVRWHPGGRNGTGQNAPDAGVHPVLPHERQALRPGAYRLPDLPGFQLAGGGEEV